MLHVFYHQMVQIDEPIFFEWSTAPEKISGGASVKVTFVRIQRDWKTFEHHAR